MQPTRLPAARLGTRLAFLSAGVLIGSWAPLIPGAKDSTGLNEAQFGLALLCFGLGSLASMLVVGGIVGRLGTKPVIALGGGMAALALPAATLATGGWELGFGLGLFGAALGALDVAMNVNGSRIEALEQRPLMSGFHAMYSIGGLLGALAATALVFLSLPAVVVAAICAAPVLAVVLKSARHALAPEEQSATFLTWPRGPVLIFASLVCITFLAEGAIIDWGGLLMVERGLTTMRTAGLAFVAFSVGMVTMRLLGDRAVERFGAGAVLVTSGCVTVVGMVGLLIAPWMVIVLGSFCLVGLGAATIAPILFSACGRQNAMSVGQAISVVAIAGYGGHLMGPFVVGFIAQATSLAFAMGTLATAFVSVPVAAVLIRKTWR